MIREDDKGAKGRSKPMENMEVEGLPSAAWQELVVTLVMQLASCSRTCEGFLSMSPLCVVWTEALAESDRE